MNKPVFQFHKQLKKGKKAEELFIKDFKLDGETLTLSGVRSYDFTTVSGLKVELKTDFHTSTNFYIERSYGKEGDEKDGSFWQSHSHGVDVLIYWFINSGEVFIFRRLPAVIKYLNSYIKTMRPPPNVVTNYTFCGVGYKIPKAALKHLYTMEVHNVVPEELDNSI